MTLRGNCCQIVHFMLLEQSSGTVEDEFKQSPRATSHQDHRIVIVDDDILALSVGGCEGLAQNVPMSGIIQVDFDEGSDASHH